MIVIDYKDGRTLFEQIEQGIKQLIISGGLKENEPLPSVRELSVQLTVNPNTVQRAYKALEQNGFIYSLKGKGSFVAPVKKSENASNIESLFASVANSIQELKFLGVTREELLDKIGTMYGEGDKND